MSHHNLKMKHFLFIFLLISFLVVVRTEQVEEYEVIEYYEDPTEDENDIEDELEGAYTQENVVSRLIKSIPHVKVLNNQHDEEEMEDESVNVQQAHTESTQQLNTVQSVQNPTTTVQNTATQQHDQMEAEDENMLLI